MTIYSGLNSSIANLGNPAGATVQNFPIQVPNHAITSGRKFPRALKAVRSSGTVTQRSETDDYSTDIFVWGSDKNG